MTIEEDNVITMLGYLLDSMRNSVESCNHKTVLNVTTNLAVNIDRAHIRDEKSENFLKNLKDIDKKMINLKKIFAEKCECRRK